MNRIQQQLVSWLASSVVQIADINPDDITTAMLRGSAEFHDVSLRTKFFNSHVPHGVPLYITGGSVGRVLVQVPWLSLSTGCVEVTVSGTTMVMCVRQPIAVGHTASDSILLEKRLGENLTREALGLPTAQRSDDNQQDLAAATNNDDGSDIEFFDAKSTAESEESFVSLPDTPPVVDVLSSVQGDGSDQHVYVSPEMNSFAAETQPSATIFRRMISAVASWATPKSINMRILNSHCRIHCGAHYIELSIEKMLIDIDPNKVRADVVVSGVCMNLCCCEAEKVAILENCSFTVIATQIANKFHVDANVDAQEINFAEKSVHALLSVMLAVCRELTGSICDDESDGNTRVARRRWSKAIASVLSTVRSDWNAVQARRTAEFGELRRNYLAVLRRIYQDPNTFEVESSRLLELECHLMFTDVIEHLRLVARNRFGIIGPLFAVRGLSANEGRATAKPLSLSFALVSKGFVVLLPAATRFVLSQFAIAGEVTADLSPRPLHAQTASVKQMTSSSSSAIHIAQFEIQSITVTHGADSFAVVATLSPPLVIYKEQSRTVHLSQTRLQLSPEHLVGFISLFGSLITKLAEIVETLPVKRTVGRNHRSQRTAKAGPQRRARDLVASSPRRPRLISRLFAIRLDRATVEWGDMRVELVGLLLDTATADGVPRIKGITMKKLHVEFASATSTAARSVIAPFEVLTQTAFGDNLDHVVLQVLPSLDVSFQDEFIAALITQITPIVTAVGEHVVPPIKQLLSKRSTAAAATAMAPPPIENISKCDRACSSAPTSADYSQMIPTGRMIIPVVRVRSSHINCAFRNLSFDALSFADCTSGLAPVVRLRFHQGKVEIGAEQRVMTVSCSSQLVAAAHPPGGHEESPTTSQSPQSASHSICEMCVFFRKLSTKLQIPRVKVAVGPQLAPLVDISGFQVVSLKRAVSAIFDSFTFASAVDLRMEIEMSPKNASFLFDAPFINATQTLRMTILSLTPAKLLTVPFQEISALVAFVAPVVRAVPVIIKQLVLNMLSDVNMNILSAADSVIVFPNGRACRIGVESFVNPPSEASSPRIPSPPSHENLMSFPSANFMVVARASLDAMEMVLRCAPMQFVMHVVSDAPTTVAAGESDAAEFRVAIGNIEVHVPLPHREWWNSSVPQGRSPAQFSCDDVQVSVAMISPLDDGSQSEPLVNCLMMSGILVSGAGSTRRSSSSSSSRSLKTPKPLSRRSDGSGGVNAAFCRVDAVSIIAGCASGADAIYALQSVLTILGLVESLQYSKQFTSHCISTDSTSAPPPLLFKDETVLFCSADAMSIGDVIHVDGFSLQLDERKGCRKRQIHIDGVIVLFRNCMFTFVLHELQSSIVDPDGWLGHLGEFIDISRGGSFVVEGDTCTFATEVLPLPTIVEHPAVVAAASTVAPSPPPLSFIVPEGFQFSIANVDLNVTIPQPENASDDPEESDVPAVCVHGEIRGVAAHCAVKTSHSDIVPTIDVDVSSITCSAQPVDAAAVESALDRSVVFLSRAQVALHAEARGEVSDTPTIGRKRMSLQRIELTLQLAMDKMFVAVPLVLQIFSLSFRLLNEFRIFRAGSTGILLGRVDDSASEPRGDESASSVSTAVERISAILAMIRMKAEVVMPSVSVEVLLRAGVPLLQMACSGVTATLSNDPAAPSFKAAPESLKLMFGCCVAVHWFSLRTLAWEPLLLDTDCRGRATFEVDRRSCKAVGTLTHVQLLLNETFVVQMQSVVKQVIAVRPRLMGVLRLCDETGLGFALQCETSNCCFSCPPHGTVVVEPSQCNALHASLYLMVPSNSASKVKLNFPLFEEKDEETEPGQIAARRCAVYIAVGVTLFARYVVRANGDQSIHLSGPLRIRNELSHSLRLLSSSRHHHSFSDASATNCSHSRRGFVVHPQCTAAVPLEFLHDAKMLMAIEHPSPAGSIGFTQIRSKAYCLEESLRCIAQSAAASSNDGTGTSVRELRFNFTPHDEPERTSQVVYAEMVAVCDVRALTVTAVVTPSMALYNETGLPLHITFLDNDSTPLVETSIPPGARATCPLRRSCMRISAALSLSFFSRGFTVPSVFETRRPVTIFSLLESTAASLPDAVTLFSTVSSSKAIHLRLLHSHPNDFVRCSTLRLALRSHAMVTNYSGVSMQVAAEDGVATEIASDAALPLNSAESTPSRFLLPFKTGLSLRTSASTFSAVFHLGEKTCMDVCCPVRVFYPATASYLDGGSDNDGSDLEDPRSFTIGEVLRLRPDNNSSETRTYSLLPKYHFLNESDEFVLVKHSTEIPFSIDNGQPVGSEYVCGVFELPPRSAFSHRLCSSNGDQFAFRRVVCPEAEDRSERSDTMHRHGDAESDESSAMWSRNFSATPHDSTDVLMFPTTIGGNEFHEVALMWPDRGEATIIRVGPQRPAFLRVINATPSVMYLHRSMQCAARSAESSSNVFHTSQSEKDAKYSIRVDPWSSCSAPSAIVDSDAAVFVNFPAPAVSLRERVSLAVCNTVTVNNGRCAARVLKYNMMYSQPPGSTTLFPPFVVYVLQVVRCSFVDRPQASVLMSRIRAPTLLGLSVDTSLSIRQVSLNILRLPRGENSSNNAILGSRDEDHVPFCRLEIDECGISISAHNELGSNIADVRFVKFKFTDHGDGAGCKPIVEPVTGEISVRNMHVSHSVETGSITVGAASIRSAVSPIVVSAGDELLQRMISFVTHKGKHKKHVQGWDSVAAKGDSDQMLDGAATTATTTTRCTPAPTHNISRPLLIRFEHISLPRIPVIFSWSQTNELDTDILPNFLQWFISSVDHAQLTLPVYERHHAVGIPVLQFIADVGKHYSAALLQQWSVVLGSCTAIGSPVSTIFSVVNGVTSLLTEKPSVGVPTFLRDAFGTPLAAASAMLTTRVKSLFEPRRAERPATAAQDAVLDSWICTRCRDVEEVIGGNAPLWQVIQRFGLISLLHHTSWSEFDRCCDETFVPDSNRALCLPALRDKARESILVSEVDAERELLRKSLTNIVEELKRRTGGVQSIDDIAPPNEPDCDARALDLPVDVLHLRIVRFVLQNAAERQPEQNFPLIQRTLYDEVRAKIFVELQEAEAAKGSNVESDLTGP